jgi:glycosyltransferase involved in cell wall biosynthesis
LSRNSVIVTVMIPAYNEEASLGDVIAGIPRRFDGCEVRVLVVDDGSTDRTAEVAKANADFCLSLGTKRGLARAFTAGLAKALEIGSDIIVNIDADGQYKPEQIPDVVRPVLAGLADMVLGVRSGPGMDEMSLGKKIGNRISTAIASRLAGVRISDAQTGFRAFSKEAVMRLVILGNYTHVHETLLQATQKGLRIVEVPIIFQKRRYGKSRLVQSLGSYAGRAGLGMLRTYRDYRPMATFLTIGGALFLAGLLVGVRVLIYFVQTGHVTPFIPSAILTAVLMILGFQVVFLGLLADMLGAQRSVLEEVLYLLRAQQLSQRQSPLRTLRDDKRP